MKAVIFFLKSAAFIMSLIRYSVYFRMNVAREVGRFIVRSRFIFVSLYTGRSEGAREYGAVSIARRTVAFSHSLVSRPVFATESTTNFICRGCNE
jgi:hypothetical protein